MLIVLQIIHQAVARKVMPDEGDHINQTIAIKILNNFPNIELVQGTTWLTLHVMTCSMIVPIVA